MQWVTLYRNFCFTITVFNKRLLADHNEQLSKIAEETADAMTMVRMHRYEYTSVQFVLNTSPPSSDHSWRYHH